MKNLDRKLIYFKHKITQNTNIIDMKINFIDQYARIYNLDCRELYGILLLEHINRGSLITKGIEKTILKFFPQIAIRMDLSLGIAQIKISTAKKFYPNNHVKVIARKLLTDEFNIQVCAQIINDYNHFPDKDNKLLGLVKKYTTGNVNSTENTSIIIYYLLLKWIKDSLISN